MTNQFNLCRECKHINNCVLTNQKEKVFSCSEFDEKLEEKPMGKTRKMNQPHSSIRVELEMAG